MYKTKIVVEAELESKLNEFRKFGYRASLVEPYRNEHGAQVFLVIAEKDEEKGEGEGFKGKVIEK